MTRLRPVAGGGIIAGWSLSAAAVRAESVLNQLRLREAIWGARDLLADFAEHPALWPARNQGHRATCNAFAVVAAEELYHWRRTGSLKPLSEELLYKDMRARPVPVTSKTRTPEQIDTKTKAAAASGNTFLTQALAVLAEKRLPPASDAPYETGPGLPHNHVTSRPVPPAAPIAQRPNDLWLHDIMADTGLPSSGNWTSGGPGSAPLALSELFHARLSAGVPVVASFALPQGVGIDAFIGADGRFAGQVRYPPPEVLSARQADAVLGHTVCLVGYRPGTSAGAADGLFVFRNSLGVVRQAARAGRSNDPRQPDHPGYGTIRVADVETFCWEYLCRADGIALPGPV